MRCVDKQLQPLNGQDARHDVISGAERRPRGQGPRGSLATGSNSCCHGSQVKATVSRSGFGLCDGESPSHLDLFAA